MLIIFFGILEACGINILSKNNIKILADRVLYYACCDWY